ncbi:unnamed protein product [Polarella glacialis]|uniref:CobW C-terminal domain-containing protein n=1 Tax=Polarella glacialis TaxID=89957 RepID=A0A813GUA0_POLGL|nr:unnamed protein product [Polarella glacialis]
MATEPTANDVDSVTSTGKSRCLVPVTLLTGFLGAGKTARLNATLVASGGGIAVIENELGVLGVDGLLVANSHPEADGIIELANGCLCCSAEVDLIAALEALARRHRVKPLKRVIIETTGLADVGPVIALLEDPEDPLAEDFILDAVVTVVDAASFKRWAQPAAGAAAGLVSSSSSPISSWTTGFGNHGTVSSVKSEERAAFHPGRATAVRTFWRQVSFADQILLSKVDLVGEESAQQILSNLQAANPLAEFCDSSSAANTAPLPPPRGRKRGSPSAVRGALDAWQQASTPSGRLCGASAARLRSAHLEGVETLSLRLPPERPLQKEPLLRLAKALLAGEGLPTSAPGPLRAGEEARSISLGEVWRIKGLLGIHGRGPSLLQGVGDQVSLEPFPDAQGVAPFLVLIGEGLQQEQEALQAAFEACGAESAGGQALKS